jgi:ATP-dependent RNA helicase DeaD
MSETAPSSTPATDFSELLGPELASAITKKGYTSLTPVQLSVLDPELEGRDLRISSQTGSGKTLAIGFVLRSSLAADQTKRSPVARPQAIVIVPTRELAKQVNDELTWLYAPMKLRIASVIGGSSYRDEHRALSAGPAIVVGTPGRLLDHLNRGGIEAEDVKAVVLDEADRMLDLGFRDELEAILQKAPPGHRTHLVSATFARDVAALADRVQQNPKRIEGTPLGSANRDIDHIVYLVHPRERVDALINVLLHHADEQTLVFARTRADVSEIAGELQQAGFASGALSGEMSQDARNRALAAFKRGDIRALIATDVAARGIDVQDIARVIQIDPPTDPDTYTHRSGRTGRAGRKGVSAVLVAPAGLRRAASLMQRAKVQYRIEPIPTAEIIRKSQDELWLNELTEHADAEVPERVQQQVARIVEQGLTERALARLIINVRRATGEPRDVTPLFPEPQRGAWKDSPPRANDRGRDRGPRQDDRGPRYPERGPQFPERGSQFPERAPRANDRGPRPEGNPGDWVPFRVSWGEQHGADARRLVAMLCRRGNVRGTDIGAIRVGATSSTVEVAAAVAQGFAESTREPDPRDPRVVVTPFTGVPTREPQPERSEQRPRAHVPPSQHRAPRDDGDERPAPRAFAPKAPVRDFAAKAPPRDFAPKPFVRDFAKGPPRDFAKGPPRDFAKGPPRDFAKGPPRDFAKGPPRDFAKGPPRDFAPKAPVRDEAPKRRKIVVTAPPTRRGPKKK